MKNFLLFFCLIQSCFLSAQISCHTKDTDSNEAIPYVNIWVQGKEYGYTSDEKGNFVFRKNDTDESFIFSAVGYKKKTVKIKDIQDVVYLEREIYQLSEVKVLEQKKKKTNRIGLLKGKIEYALNVGTNDESKPIIVARFFPPNEEIPFLKTIKIKTFNDLESPIFNLRFYDVAENGEPNDLLYNENLLCTTKKGKHTNTIDVSELNITIPENGIFVAVEYLHIDQNRKELEYQNKQGKHILYEPRMPLVYIDESTDTWRTIGGDWIKYDKTSLGLELVLSN